MTHSWTYVLLEKLVKKGFLQKESENGRKVIYELTDFGETVAKRWIDLVEVLAEKQEPQLQTRVEKWKVI
jgi:DNA-binding PadR family transcriptional regulator